MKKRLKSSVVDISGVSYEGKLGNRDYELVLKDVNSHDDAEYTVTATNIAGTARSTAQLIVSERRVVITRTHVNY